MGLTLRIYADEAGTMPIHDDDEVFIVAAFAVLGDDPIPRVPGRLGIQKTARLLRSIAAYAGCWYVKPCPGYESAVRAKFTAMDTMGRARALVSGRQECTGLGLRNWVWTLAMTEAVGSLLSAIVAHHGEAPVRIAAYLDQKTLRPGEEELLEIMARRIAPIAADVLRRAVAKFRPGPRLAAAAAFRTTCPVAIRIDDGTSAFPGSRDGMRAVDSLAGHFFAELRRSRSKPGILAPGSVPRCRIPRSTRP